MMPDLEPEGVVEPEPNDPDPAADAIRPDRPRIWPEEPRAPKPQIKRPLEEWLVEWDDRVQKNDGRTSQPNRRRRPRGLDRLIPINTRPERPAASEVPARGGSGGGGGRRRRRGGGGGGGGGNAAAGTSSGGQTQQQPRSGQRQRGQQPGRQGQGQQQQPRGNQQARPPRQMGQPRRGPEGGQDRRPPAPPLSDGSPGSRPPQGQGDPNRRRRRRGRGRGPRPNGPPRADGPSSSGTPPPA